MNKELLLLALFACHFLADYTELSTIWMLKAKQFGKPLFPIFCHALVHGLMMGLVLHFWLPGNWFKWDIVDNLIIFQVVTHFMFDVLKGRFTYWYPIFQDKMKYPYWRLMGFDQLLHTIVIIWMVYFALK